MYEQFINEALTLCEEEGIGLILLTHFGDQERDDPGSGIPEPTLYGAIQLAKLIQEAMFRQIEKEEN